MWRAALVSLALLVPGAAHAQQETLADIRQELSVLYVELQRLRGELNTTGAPSGSGGGGSVLSRVDAIEAELRRLTSATEELELRIDRVVSDGTTRVGDLDLHTGRDLDPWRRRFGGAGPCARPDHHVPRHQHGSGRAERFRPRHGRL